MIRQHPDVFAAPTKELHFFNRRSNYRKGIEWYRSQFAGYNGEKAIGELTPNYLWTSIEEKGIQTGNRSVDIPNKGILEVGHKRGIISMGLYYSQLCEWLKYFRQDQFLILIYEYDIKHNKEQTLIRVFRFLGVDEQLKPASMEKRYNARSGHFYMHLHYYFPFPKLVRGLFTFVPALH